MKSAFTLIELLVVIAIIAVLAAILFPVFAQAKAAAQKSASISNIKQLGTAIAVYVGDTDDTYLLTLLTIDGVWRFAYSPGVPQGWDGSRWSGIDAAAWPNSARAYTKDEEILSAPGLPRVDYPGANYGNTNGIIPTYVNYGMNGLLHAYSATAVAQPSRTPLLWQGGGGKVNLRGYVNNSPRLACSGSQSCRFNLGGSLTEGAGIADLGDLWYQPGLANPEWASVHVHGRGRVFAAADTSAKFRSLNPGGSPEPKASIQRSVCVVRSERNAVHVPRVLCERCHAPLLQLLSAGFGVQLPVRFGSGHGVQPLESPRPG